MVFRLLLVLSLCGSLFVHPVQAAPMDHQCDAPTVMALQHCVHHALEQGFIDSPAVADSLLAKLEAAASALDRGQSLTAVKQIQAFIYEVAAQSGVHIDTAHAGHLQAHARRVIDALNS